MIQFSGFMFPEAGRNFQATYKCSSVSMLPGNERQDVERGGKIIMPPSALDTLTRLNVVYPMLFKLTNGKKNRTTHAGVLEFVAGEGKCYLPYWMMANLLIEEGGMLSIESVSLPVATYSKFQPQSSDFLDITNPKAVLENALRNFACLTTGDVIAIQYNRKVYELCVLETKPGNAVTIIECDMNVEFEAPVGYKEPVPAEKEEKPEDETEKSIMEVVEDPFGTSGVRLDGKKIREGQIDATPTRRALPRGQPDYNYEFGLLLFDRSIKPISDRQPKVEEEDKEPEDPFKGEGFSMRRQKKNH